MALLGFPALTLAHITQSHGDLSVLFHTDPDDDPIVGQPAVLHFAVSYKNNPVKAQNCACGLIIKDEQGKVLLSKSDLSLQAGPSIYTFAVPFVFPQKAVYSIVLSLNYKAENSFQPFTFLYNLRVDRTGVIPTWQFFAHFLHPEHWLHILLFAVAIGANAWVYMKNRKSKAAV